MTQSSDRRPKSAPRSVDARLFERGLSAARPIVREFALVLLQFGLSPNGLRRIAEIELVLALRDRTRFANGRDNQSRLAAITGLSRSQVRLILASADAEAAKSIRKPTSGAHIDRVLDGWMTDPRFQTRSREPRELSLTDLHRGFADLVRQHAGDIPASAVLRELVLKGVAVRRGSKVRLKAGMKERDSVAARRLRSHRTILLALLRSIRSDRALEDSDELHVVRLVPRSEVEHRMLTKRARNILTTARSALEELSSSRLVRAAPSPGRRGTVMIATVMARTDPEELEGDSGRRANTSRTCDAQK
jgi:hypothetical protein